MSERKYSVDEIEWMRRSLRTILTPINRAYNAEELNAQIEGQLQTYMRNGTTPAELEQMAGHVIAAQQRMASL